MTSSEPTVENFSKNGTRRSMLSIFSDVINMYGLFNSVIILSWSVTKYGDRYPLSISIPSTKSTSYLIPGDCSTDITPSFPTLLITDPTNLPISSSWAESTAIWEIWSSSVTDLDIAFNSATIDSTAFNMPCFINIGSAPAAMFLNPFFSIAWANIVEVVVPSPTSSFVFDAASTNNCAPILWKGSSSSISLAMVTPSLHTCGGPNSCSITTLRPLGPNVAPTVRAIMSMPSMSCSLASSRNWNCFGIDYLLTIQWLSCFLLIYEQ